MVCGKKSQNKSRSRDLPVHIAKSNPAVRNGFQVPKEVQRLLTTNDPSSESVKPLIFQTIEALSLELKALAIKVVEAEHDPVLEGALLREHLVKTTLRKAVQRICSAFRRLPREVILRIMSFCASMAIPRPSQENGSVVIPSISFTSLPWTLTWISSFWRSLAESEASLWTHVGVSMYGSEGDANLLELQLERTGGLPLVAVIDGSEVYPLRIVSPGLFKIWPLLQKMSMVWKEVHIVSTTRFLIEWVQLMPQPHVSVVVVDFRGSRQQWNGSFHLDMGMGMQPELLTLTIMGQITLRYSLRNLQSLLWYGVPDGEVCVCTLPRALLWMPNLVDLEVHDFRVCSLEPPGFVSMTLPRLEHLVVSGERRMQSVVAKVVIQGLTAPNLEYLAVESSNHELSSILVDFLSRSMCPVKKLIFDLPGIPDQERIRVFQNVPTLEQLIVLGGDGLPEGVASALIEEEEEEEEKEEEIFTLLPRLVELTLRTGWSCPPAVLQELLGARGFVRCPERWVSAATTAYWYKPEDLA